MEKPSSKDTKKGGLKADNSEEEKDEELEAIHKFSGNEDAKTEPLNKTKSSTAEKKSSDPIMEDVNMKDTMTEEEVKGNEAHESTSSDEQVESEKQPMPSEKKKKSGKTDSPSDEQDEMDEDEPDSETVPKSGKKKGGENKKRKASPTPPGREGRRRERKSVETYDPAEQVKPAPSKPTPQKVAPKTPTTVVNPSKPTKPNQKGRGKNLSEFPEVVDGMKKAHYDDLILLYRLLFVTRGRVAKKELIPSVLSYSGYLPPKNPNIDEEEQAEVDNECEMAMGTKAYRLSIPQLQRICDMMGVDRSGAGDMKDYLVDTILDFLGEPSLMYQKPHNYIEERRKRTKKSPNKRDSTKKKGAEVKKEEESEDNNGDNNEEKTEDMATEEQIDEPDLENSDDDYDTPHVDASAPDKDYGDVEDTKIADNAKPTNKTLRRWVRAYVRCHNMKTSTMQMAIEVASVKFGVDMTDRKRQIREFLVEEL